MTPPHLATIRQRRADLIEVRETPDAVSTALSRYLTLRSVGYIEAIRDDLADLYSYRCGNTRLHRRVRHHLRSGLGVTPEQLLTFVGSFDTEWRSSLEIVLNNDDRALRDQLGAMVAARKKIAHGDGDQVTVGRSLIWSDIALTLGTELQKFFDPDSAQ